MKRYVFDNLLLQYFDSRGVEIKKQTNMKITDQFLTDNNFNYQKLASSGSVKETLKLG